MRTLRRRWILLFLLGGVLFLHLPVARADLTLTLQSGSATQTATSSSGFVSYTGAVGGWNVNNTSGIAFPLVNQPLMDLDTLSVSTSGTVEDLLITLTGTGFTAPTDG